MAAPHVLLVAESCVDRLVASRVLETCNIRGEMTNMDFPFAFCMISCFVGFLILRFILIANGGLVIVTCDAIDTLKFLCSVVVTIFFAIRCSLSYNRNSIYTIYNIYIYTQSIFLYLIFFLHLSGIVFNIYTVVVLIL